MRGPRFWALVILGSGLSLSLFWLTGIPLGVPGEWTWARHDVTPDLVANLLLALVIGGGYLWFVAVGYRRLARPCSRWESFGWLIGLGILAGAWIWTVQGQGSTGATIGRWPFVLYYPSSSGYFFKARFESPRAREFLQNYEALMKEGDVLHVGTHPPGLFLFFHGLHEVIDRHPEWIDTINSTQPPVIREAFDVIDIEGRKAIDKGDRRTPLLLTVDRAILWLAGLICFGLSAATVWPLYGFLRQLTDRPVSWLGAAVWPLIPAVAVFLPKSDVAFAFFAMLLGWLWLLAWRRRSVWLAGAAGAVWTLGLLCSLAFLPVALWLALLSLFESWPALRAGEKRAELVRALRTIVPAGIVTLLLLSALSWWGDIPLWKTFWLNYRNHAGFYAQYPRTYLAWLALNPWELACSLGFPLFVAAGFGVATVLRPRGNGERAPLTAACLATVIVWSWLWLSGKNSGEAARLWIFLLPYLAACSAACWIVPAETTPPRKWPWEALAWLACQAAVCFGTVQRIDGFPIG